MLTRQVHYSRFLINIILSIYKNRWKNRQKSNLRIFKEVFIADSIKFSFDKEVMQVCRKFTIAPGACLTHIAKF